MPDWTYQTVFQPVLRRLPFAVAQRLAFGTMGQLGRFAVGRAIIRLMGHAAPPTEIAFQKTGLTFPAACGLACGIDQSGQATSALCLFGFGLIEVGPVCVGRADSNFARAAEWRDRGVAVSTQKSAVSCQQMLKSLQRNRVRSSVPVIVRLVVTPQTEHDELRRVAAEFSPQVSGFSVWLSRSDQSAAAPADIFGILREGGCRVLAVVSTDSMANGGRLREALDSGLLDGVIVEGGLDEQLRRGQCGEDAVYELAQCIASVNSEGRSWLLASSGTVVEPADAMRLLDAGADIVIVDSGMAVSGPGLPKRINTAARARLFDREPERFHRIADDEIPMSHRSWFWAMLLGLSLTAGGVMSLLVGLTRIVLPYDEEFLGMLRAEICSLNPRLLPFMSHDRVTVAGTMLALGPLYMVLAWFGDRRGHHWARVAILASAFAGFLSFFLFLGFGYFDPFHAFVSGVLFQFTTLCLRSSQPIAVPEPPDLHNCVAWKRAMWGQLLMVCQGAAILVAGLVISCFAVTSVFVPSDLEYMQTSRELLLSANARLVPLVAHDRAAFGGMLMSTGIVVLLSALWGWQRSRAWLWHSLLFCGTLAYGTTIAIHWAVGYTSLIHLLPAYGGLAVLWLGMAMSASWMLKRAAA
ncbi:MAG: hypothetical protein R3C49_11575 [Planctomycetaceae bacterium]